MKPIKRALISVFDKTGIIDFARELSSLGVEIMSTGGTAKLLRNQGLSVTIVSDYTGFPEIMDGRVKTLHPKIYGGILARRDIDSHMQAIEKHDIRTIDLVAINLYPFETTIAREDCTIEDAAENIDIGGPCMIRAAAKNFNDVTVVVDPNNYASVLFEIKENSNSVCLDTRRRLSRDAFEHTARYDSLIAEYLSGTITEKSNFSPWLQKPFHKIQELRYGENPHQSAAFYRETGDNPSDITRAKQLQGKELSFNNIIDLDAAWSLATEFENGSAVIIKHTNPCGVAVGENQLETFVKARETDSISAFGGIIGFNRPITAKTADEIVKNFVEAIVAPGYEPGVLEIFSAKKNVRLLELPLPKEPKKNTLDLKRVSGGLLAQDSDSIILDLKKLKIVSKRHPTPGQLEDLKFAWTIAKHVKSNAIIYAKNLETVGVGAGQMSRVDSARLAIQKSNKEVNGCVMASDAFFPFRDSVDAAAEAEVSAIIQPGGSIRDGEVIQSANEHNLAMVFTGIRHFKH